VGIPVRVGSFDQLPKNRLVDLSLAHADDVHGHVVLLEELRMNRIERIHEFERILFFEFLNENFNENGAGGGRVVTMLMIV